MSKALKNKDLYAIVIVVMLTFIANILISNGKHDSNMWIIHGALTGISQSIWLISIIKMIERPIIGLFGLIVSELILMVCDILSGLNLNDIIENASITLCILICGTLVNLMITLSNIKKEKNLDKISINELKESILIKRKPIGVKLWIHVIVYSTIITVIATLATSEVFSIYGENTDVRIILAMSLLIPVFLNIAAITSSIIVIELFILKIITEIAILISIMNIGTNMGAKIIYLLAEIFTLIYCMIKMSAREEK